MSNDLQDGGPMHARFLGSYNQHKVTPEPDRRTMRLDHNLNKPVDLPAYDMFSGGPSDGAIMRGIEVARLGWRPERREFSTWTQAMQYAVDAMIGRDTRSLLLNPKQHMPFTGFDPNRRADPEQHESGLDGYKRVHRRPEHHGEYIGTKMLWLRGQRALLLVDDEFPHFCYAQFDRYWTGYGYGRWLFNTTDFFILLPEH